MWHVAAACAAQKGAWLARSRLWLLAGLWAADSAPLLPWEAPGSPEKAAGASTCGLPYPTQGNLPHTGVRVQGCAWWQIAVQICGAAVCPTGNSHPCACMLIGMHPLWIDSNMFQGLMFIRELNTIFSIGFEDRSGNTIDIWSKSPALTQFHLSIRLFLIKWIQLLHY